MDGSPSSVISLGFGSWGSIGLVVTLGYGIGVSSPVTLVGTWSKIIECVSANQRIECKSKNKRIDCYSANEEL